MSAAAPARRPRVLVLSLYYRPEPNFIVGDVADALRHSADVTVVTAHPNYPVGKFYPSVRRWWWPARTVEGGVVVWRLPMIPDRSTSVRRRAVAYLSFTVAALLVVPFVARRTRLVWVYQTPPTVALAALWCRLTSRARLTLTYADLWPESFAAAGVAPAEGLMRTLYRLRSWINARADLIVGTTRGTVARFRADGVPEGRLRHIPTWVDGLPSERDVASAAADASGGGPAEPPVIVYAGALGPAQALDTLVRAAAILERTGDRFAFHVYGAGPAEGDLRALAEQLGATSVRFLGRVSPDESFRASAAAFAQVVSLIPTPLFRMTVPSKLSFAMAAGAPILAGLEGEALEIAEACGGAVRFDSADPESLAAAVRRLAALPASERGAMADRMRRFFVERYSRERLVARYREALEPLLQAAS